jgi:hypothetical protein
VAPASHWLEALSPISDAPSSDRFSPLDETIQRLLGRVDPALNLDPYTAPPFLELSDRAKNGYASALRAMHDDEWRNPRLKLYGVNAALNTAAVALKEFRPKYAVHGTSHSEEQYGR